MISFHNYVIPPDTWNVTEYEQFFPDSDTFVAEVAAIGAIRDKLAPKTEVRTRARTRIHLHARTSTTTAVRTPEA